MARDGIDHLIGRLNLGSDFANEYEAGGLHERTLAPEEHPLGSGQPEEPKPGEKKPKPKTTKPKEAKSNGNA